jgi:intracellular multiplication protein IcmL
MAKMTEEQHWEQNIAFYRHGYRRILIALIALGIVCVSLAATLVIQTFSERQPSYYATTTAGQVIPIQSLAMPVVSNQYLLEWAQLAVRRCYNLDFLNYAKQLHEASTYFTTAGWESFTTAFNGRGVLKKLRENKLFMSAVVNGAPVILAQDVVRGRYVWRVQMPVLVTFTSASETRQSSMLVTITIMRVPVLDAAKGMQVSSFNVGNYL